jgi:hypothetical protein
MSGLPEPTPRLLERSVRRVQWLGGCCDDLMLQHSAHSLLELQGLRFTGGVMIGCWRGGRCGSDDIFLIFLRILLTLIWLILRLASPIGSICASPSRPF